MTSLVWYRTDLRVHDHAALREAMAEGEAIAMFYCAPKQWRAHDDAPAKVDFWLRNLRTLSDSLDQLGVPLLLIEATDWHDAPSRISTFCHAHDVTSVHVHAECGVNEALRDQRVAERLADDDIAWHVHHGDTLLTPGTVLTGQGSAYKVFTPFARASRNKLAVAPRRPLAAPKAQRRGRWTRDEIPAHLTGYGHPPADAAKTWPAGEDHAHQALADFCDSAIADYTDARDKPAIDGTSRLSAYLNAGVVSPVQCLHAALRANDGEIDSGKQGARTWMTELIWRDFYRHLMSAYPELSKHKPMQPHTDKVQWRESEEDLEAWQTGRTGIPIVDAAMRQLLAMHWMHNRLRMVSAMFLSKNLLLDWREGEAWFMQHLIDGDLASNNGGWQWSASTGADASPYFRVFNPIAQSRKFDPEGAFIRKWVPELAGLDKRAIHEPSDAQRAECGYPMSIVDLSSSRKRAIDAFRGLPRDRSPDRGGGADHASDGSSEAG